MYLHKRQNASQTWYLPSVIPALRKPRQEGYPELMTTAEFQANLGFRVGRFLKTAKASSWCMPETPVSGRERQEGHGKFQLSLVYRKFQS